MIFACIIIILLQAFLDSWKCKWDGGWPFDHLWFLLPKVPVIVGEDGKTFGTELAAIAKRSSYKFTTNPPYTLVQRWQLLLGRFPSIWYWQFKTGLFVVVFMTPLPLCFAINSRYEGRANKTAIVRAIRAITPDKPLPKCSSASSKSNQVIKQQIWNFTSPV